MAKSPPLILVDGSSYLYRAFHAIRELNTSDGRPTNAIFGVINMLRKLINDYQPEHMVVVFDARGKTFRHEKYADYKANRPPMPDELRSQIDPLHEIVKALGLPMVVEPGVEADDVIGTLANRAAAKKQNVLISTGDKDLAQLVNKHVTLINTMTDTLMDEQGVVDKFGVKPEQIIDYLTLVGDTSDNIPGVPKVGPKTAVKWLTAYENLDNILQHEQDIKGKVGENLRDSREQIPMSRDLVTIRCELELKNELTDMSLQPANDARLRELYHDLEFRSWLRELGDEGGEPPAEASMNVDTRYETVVDEKSFKRWLKKLKVAKHFAFDTETTSLVYTRARVVGVSFAVEEFEAAYVPFGHDYPDAPPQLSEELVLGALKPLLEDERVLKIGQNLKYDAHVLRNHDIVLRGIEHDTMLQSYVLDSSERHDMDSLALKHLGVTTIHFEDIAGKGVKQLTFNDVPIEQAGPYAAEDADITLRLHNLLHARFDEYPGLLAVYRDIEIPLLNVLQRMEQNGVMVDSKMLIKQSKQLSKRMIEVEKQAHEAAEETFNLASPAQLQTILFDKLKLRVIRKTPKGQPSTAEDVLQELAMEAELPRLVLEHRSLSKLKSTYTDKLPAQVNPHTGRIHTSYHQAVAATGRLSSKDPNLQNIPIKTDDGRRIRYAFVAPEGCSILAADYSQIELRIMAHLSADEALFEAFAQGLDIHSATAAEVFGVKTEDVVQEQRRAAKAINFGLIYGMSAFGLAKQLGTTRAVAQDYVDLYFERYPGVLAYMDKTRKSAHEIGYVETVFGRRLYLPEINAKNAQRRQYAERTAINAPMQGTAADIIKRAMITVDEQLLNSKLDARLIMQVHDELVFEVAHADLEPLGEMVRKNMESAASLSVPLIVDVGAGANWGEAH